MPNYVQNEITFRGNGEGIKKVLETISSEENGSIDFNKLVPMPKSLNMTSGSITDTAILVYLLDNCKLPLTKDIIVTYLAYTDSIEIQAAKRVGLYDLRFFKATPELLGFLNARLDYDSLSRQLERMRDRATKDGLGEKFVFSEDEDFPKLTYYEAGKRYVANIRLYGSATWYNWCCDNWGTKWNASSIEQYGTTIRFSTAWSAPRPIIERLACICEKYSVEFDGVSADEDVGSNVSKYSFADGMYNFEYLEDFSPEAYRIYEELWGSLDEDNCFGRNEDGTPYHYDCESCPNKCH